ncbi:MAG: ribosomal RNA small subunit methyltransferase A [Bacteroidales bacterium]|nr:ribosomal RNA small subunit methyltransferase A [Bacteroidales bacterium]
MTLFPKKSLGQHFLIDENIARKIVGCLNPEIPCVLEIGPGKGILTKYLLENPAFDPLFIEIDKNSVAYLKEHYPDIKGRIIEENFLNLNLKRLLEPTQNHKLSNHPTSNIQHPTSNIEHRASSLQLLGNFPYNISSQILFRVIEYKDIVGELVGMFQREVAQRIASPPGSKEYGILSVLLQAYYDIEYLLSVSEKVFQPPPKVKSALIRLKRNDVKALDCDEAFFIRVVKTAFNQRRKMLRNSLRSLAGSGFSSWDDPVMRKRPEQLSVEEFTRLTRLIQ